MGDNKRRTRAERKAQERSRVITGIRHSLLVIIILILLYMVYGVYKEAAIGTRLAKNSVENNISNEGLENLWDSGADNKQNNINKPETPVVKQYLGYKVESRLEIPKIKLKTNVLSKYSEEGLEICASKYYGPIANEIGNYCIAAHNYNKKNMFNHLIDLKIGDKVFLTDNTNGIVEYQIYDIYKVKPENIEPLSQSTRGKREITLITCVNYSRNRLVVKALEKERKG